MARSRRRSRDTNEDQEPDQGRSVAAHVRERQRAVAEREASRLARPEQRPVKTLKHADKKKSAVSSTPFGLHRNTLVDSDAEEEWCGPYSVARRMMAEREDAKRKREEEEQEQRESHPLDALVDIANLQRKRAAHPSMTWKGKVSPNAPVSTYAKRQKRQNVQRAKQTVPTLFQICIDFVVSNFEYVESLGDVDNDIRVAVSKELVARNQLDSKAFGALVDPSMETLEVIDCSGITQDVLASTVTQLSGLRYLLLTHAGRAFGSRCVKALIALKAPLSCLSLAGAYLTKDEEMAEVIRTYSESLRSLSLDTCPLLGEKLVAAVSEMPNLLELSLREIQLPDKAIELLTKSADALKNVKSLTLCSMAGFKDHHLREILRATGRTLETLDASHNFDLTDACLSGIREFSSGLRSLTLSGIKALTTTGLLTLFTHPLEGLPPPPKLKVLTLGGCDHEAVVDEVVELATSSASANVAASTPGYLSKGGGLAKLDVQGATGITDTMLEGLVKTSSQTLTEINVSYCPEVTDKGLGYLVAKCGRQLVKIRVWGCAQLSDEFFDGHDRVDDQSLEIVGAWMKKSGMGCLR